MTTTLKELLTEGDMALIHTLSTFRAVFRETTELSPLREHQLVQMGVIQVQPVVHEHAVQHVIVPGSGFSAFAERRVTPPVGEWKTVAALLGELAAWTLLGHVSCKAIAAAAPEVDLDHRRHVMLIKTSDEHSVHSIWPRTPTPTTIRALLADTATSALPITLYVPKRASGRAAIEPHARLTVQSWEALQWPRQ